MIENGEHSPRGAYDGDLNGVTDSRLAQGEFEKPRNGRKNDKAHPPIHPTAAANNLDPDERKVYELVTRRFLASCHSNAEGKTTTIEIEIADERFFTTGQSLRCRPDHTLTCRSRRDEAQLPRGISIR
jgi:DNA topoisomerase IA